MTPSPSTPPFPPFFLSPSPSPSFGKPFPQSSRLDAGGPLLLIVSEAEVTFVGALRFQPRGERAGARTRSACHRRRPAERWVGGRGVEEEGELAHAPEADGFEMASVLAGTRFR